MIKLEIDCIFSQLKKSLLYLGLKGVEGDYGPLGQLGTKGESKFNPQLFQNLFSTANVKVDKQQPKLINYKRLLKDDLAIENKSENIYSKAIKLHYKIQGLFFPNGSLQYPAKSCRDLFLNHPNKDSGSLFWKIKYFYFLNYLEASY
jgi:hypothetical protein